MTTKRGLYFVPKTLDAPTRILALPLDEFVPAALIGIFFLIIGKLIWSILLPAVVVVLIKTLKRGQGSSWLLNVCYWYFPSAVMQSILRHSPPSHQREYIG